MFLKEKVNRNASFIIFVLAENSRSHSSMDRIKDSGSFDLGSNPGGITTAKMKPLQHKACRGFLFTVVLNVDLKF